jgi:hypothetical protein
MPYIKPKDREKWASIIESCNAVDSCLLVGDLNYLITKIVDKYIQQQEDIHKGEHYQIYNSAIGALECAKLELYRRLIAPYEDIKIKQNGDVYD